MTAALRFAGRTHPVLRDDSGKAIKQLLWGDEVWVLDDTVDPWRVRARGRNGRLHPAEIEADRLLEITFVDIGQGDGALLITPQGRHYIIDAGLGDNLARFLKWRYDLATDGARKGGEPPLRLAGAVVTHPDTDHYVGLEAVFRLPGLRFETVYTNGLMEQNGAELGGAVKQDGRSVYRRLVDSTAELDAFLAVPANWKGRRYPSTLHGGRSRFDALVALHHESPPLESVDGFAIRPLGPVREPAGGLRRLGDAGVTKNGHSVVLLVQHGSVRVFLGGDLNVPAEDHLLSAHTGLPSPPRSKQAHDDLIAAARPIFGCDIAKSCHHGSADVAGWFLESLDAAAHVISSGDDEPYAHPRADTLGVLGKHSRGVRPLLFSTELSRSARETIKHPHVLRRALDDIERQLARARADGRAADVARLEKKRDSELDRALTRSVAVYGAINLRSDGREAVMAYKVERPRSREREWDIYRLAPGADGRLSYSPRHA